MKNNQFRKIGLVAAVAITTALGQVQAVDMAQASGTLAGIAVMSVQGNANLAAAANSGNVDAIAAATKSAKAINAASREAQQAFSALESAVAGNDKAAIEAAEGALEEARKKADVALNGTTPQPVAPKTDEDDSKSKKEQWKESTSNISGGSADAYDPPNIYDVLWKSAGARSVSDSMFITKYVVGGRSLGGLSFNDSEATPE